jgi:hypothetical protein
MLSAANARRRARGQAEVTVGDLEQQVMEDVREQRRRRDAYLADRELDQLLEATNSRRRARGLPERTREDVQREFGPGRSSGLPKSGGSPGVGGSGGSENSPGPAGAPPQGAPNQS